MEMSKRSKLQTECHDRLSELPDSLIFHILWFVPMKDVVRTTVLSKRWEKRWTSTPFFNFDMHDYDLDKFRNFVNRALLRWNGIRILKFKAHVKYLEIDDSIYGDTEMWVNFARDKGVEELDLDLELNDFYFNYHGAGDLFMVPRCLYSCSSLEVLSFNGCNFRINGNGNVQWNQLKSLTVTECLGVTEHLINQILSGSPRLEVLNLSFVDRGESLNIVSDSLKELWIYKSLYGRDYISKVTELTIFSPNLETLKIEGFPYTSCRLTYVPSLTHATIWFHAQIYGEQDEYGCEYDCDDFGGHLISGSSIPAFIGHSISQILQTIQHVKSVRLSFCCLEVLSAMNMIVTSSFPNVKSLKIGRCYQWYEDLVLDIFPQLERLVFEGKAGQYWDELDTYGSERILSESFLPQLRTIEVTWNDGDNIFIVLETLLKHASKLEQLVFRVNGILPPNSLLLASKKLLNMPRSSANYKISFLASDPQP